MKKWLAIVVLLSVTVGVAFFYLTSAEQEPTEFETGIRTSTVRQGDLRLAVIAAGFVMPSTELDVRTRTGGKLVKFTHEIGDVIESGQVVARIDPSVEQERISSLEEEILNSDGVIGWAKMELKDNELRYEKKRELFKKQVISRKELNEVKRDYENSKRELVKVRADLTTARQELSKARERFSNIDIRSPIKGTLVKTHLEVGHAIPSASSSDPEGTLVFTLADFGDIFIEVAVHAEEIGRVKAGDDVLIMVDQWPGEIFNGEVREVASEGRPSDRSEDQPEGQIAEDALLFDVIIDLDEQKKSRLEPGMTANVEIITEVVKGVLLVPTEAISKRAEMTGIYRPSASGPIWVQVKVGRSDGMFVEVKGLKLGDRVVVSRFDR